MADATFNYILNEDGQSYSVTCRNPTIADYASIPSTYGNDNFPVTRIGDNAFKNAQYLAAVRIPESVTEIGESAFENCKSLKSVNATLSKNLYIKATISKIGARAFAGCSLLTDAIIESADTEIEDNAFLDCTALTDVFLLPLEPSKIGKNVFDNCPVKIWTYNECVDKYKNADGWSTFGDKIEGDNNQINFKMLTTTISESYLSIPSGGVAVSQRMLVTRTAGRNTGVLMAFTSGQHGIAVTAAGGTEILTTGTASTTQINSQSGSFPPIAPIGISRAVVVGLTDNKNALTDAEKEAAYDWLGIKKYYNHALIFHKSGYLNFTVDRISSEPTAYLDSYPLLRENLFCTNSKSIVLNGVYDPSGVKSGVGTLMATMAPYDNGNEDNGVSLSGVWINYSTGEVSQVSNYVVPFENDVVTEL